MQDKNEARPSPLRGARILAVEDDFVVLLEVATILHDAGASSVRTCGTVQEALEIVEIEPFSAAILDVRLGRETIAPVARRLTDLGTPFMFYTGALINASVVAQWPQVPIVSKPAQAPVLVSTLVNVLRTGSRARTLAGPPLKSDALR